MGARGVFLGPVFEGHLASGAPAASGTLSAFATGTSNPKDIFQDALLTTPHGPPTGVATLDAAGRATVVLEQGIYDFVLKDSLGATIWTCIGYQGLAQVNDLSKSVDYAIVAADGPDVIVRVDASGAARTITLPPLATGVGTRVTVKKQDSSTNIVTVQRAGSDTGPDGSNSVVVPGQYDSLTVIGTTAGWVVQSIVRYERALSISISGGVLTLDLSKADLFYVSLNANVTSVVISNPPPSGRIMGWTLELTADGTPRTFAFGASHFLPGAATYTPTSTNNKKDTLSGYTRDGGTRNNWFIIGQNA